MQTSLDIAKIALTAVQRKWLVCLSYGQWSKKASNNTESAAEPEGQNPVFNSSRVRNGKYQDGKNWRQSEVIWGKYCSKEQERSRWHLPFYLWPPTTSTERQTRRGSKIKPTILVLDQQTNTNHCKFHRKTTPGSLQKQCLAAVLLQE